MEDKSNKINPKKQIFYDKTFFSNSLSEYAVLYGCDVLSEKELNFLASKINWKNIPEFYLSGKPELIKKLDWARFIDKMHALRIAMRDLNNLHNYPLHLYEYDADEIIRSAKIEPDLLDVLKIKKGTLKPRHIIELSKVHPHLLDKISFDEVELSNDESVEIAKMGISSIMFKININLDETNDVDKFKVIKAHFFSEESLMKMGFFSNEINNNFYTREILINTEDKFISKINIRNLTSYDWITILKHNQNLEKYISIEDFFKGDIFYFVELCLLFPKYLDYLDKDISKKITSLGWEKLLLRFKKDDNLIQMCDFDSLEERVWKTFEDKRPELLVYKN